MIEALMENKVDPATVLTPAAPDVDWFEQARFGLFVHWGIYALLGHEDAEWVLFKSKLDRKEYNRLATKFTGENFDADQLVALAKQAGMGYVVLTTRHHDGFCLFDTKTTDFNSVKTAARRDFIREFVEACRRADLKVGLYFSVMNWQQPAIYDSPEQDIESWNKMVQETHDQVRELMTNYGKIDLLWYDGSVVPGIQDKGIQARYWRSRELNSMVKELQPDILINNRSGLPEDFDTPEQHVKPPQPGRRWEACMTLNQSWGYNIHDVNFKSPEEVIKCLVRCSRYNGNLLLNIGPRGDGSVPEESVKRLEKVGTWLKCNGEAIYGSERTPYTEANHVAGAITSKGNYLYVHLTAFPGDSIVLDGVGQVDDARLLGNDIHLSVSRGAGNSAKISGLLEDMFSNGQVVIKLTLKNKPSHYASLLGGGDELRIEAGNAPVLGDDPDRFAPPSEPVRTGHFLAEQFYKASEYKTEPSEKWCHGWQDWLVFTPKKGNTIEIALSAAVAGNFDLEIGIVADEQSPIEFQIDGYSVNIDGFIRNPGVPDSWFLSNIKLASGEHKLSIKCDSHFGVYAFRLSQIWRSVPSENWYTIGPFLTEFGPQKPICEVRKALEYVFPPEKEFDLEAKYVGAKGLEVFWAHSDSREGEHTNYGVNFPYRCGTQASGVCYARTVITSPENRRAFILLGCDWWSNVWVNGELVNSHRDAEMIEQDGANFNTWKPHSAEINLQKGENTILVKCHPGTTANWFSFRISDPGDLEVKI